MGVVYLFLEALPGRYSVMPWVMCACVCVCVWQVLVRNEPVLLV